jgi:hypothetical protein
VYGRLEEGAVLSRDKVEKFFEVRLFSLAILAVTAFFLFTFLFFLFAWRGQYLYAAVMAVIALVVLFAATRLLRYANTFRKRAES